MFISQKLERTLAAVGLLTCGALVQAAPAYQINLIKNYYFDSYDVQALNNHGDAIGAYDAGWSSRNYYYVGATATYRPMRQTDGYWRDLIGGMNNHGQAAITYEDSTLWDDYKYQAQVFDSKTGVYTPLKTVSPQDSSFANGINDAGVVVGSSSFNSIKPAFHATAWINGNPTDLGTLGGGYSSAEDINTHGAIVGRSQLADGTFRAYLYQGGQMVALDTLGGKENWASAINDSQAVVGASQTAGNTYSAFIYQNGVMTDLGAGTNSFATDINAAGVVVGWADGRGFIYQNGQVTLLDQLLDPASGWQVKQVNAINDAGQIGTQVCKVSGFCVGAILTPVPEPATYGMLLAGLGVLCVAARRRGLS